MSGLMLRTGVSASLGSGTYTPMTPAAANPSTAMTGTIAQKAFGLSGSGASVGMNGRPAYGSVGIGAAAMAALIYLWWSLPR